MNPTKSTSSTSQTTKSVSALDSVSFTTVAGRAIERLKIHALRYTLGMLLVYVIGIGGMALIGGIIAVIALSSMAMGVKILICVVLFVAMVVLWVLFTSFASLYPVVLFTRNDKAGVSNDSYFALTKKLLLRYMWVMFIVGLITLGLLPFGLMTLFLLFFVWSFLTMFTGFAFIDEPELGTNSMWRSKTIVEANFGSLLKKVLPVVAIMIVGFVLLSIIGGKSGLVMMLLAVLQFYAVGFGISYAYELYQLAEKPAVITKSKLWLWLMVLGYALMVVGLILFGKMAVATMERMNRDDSPSRYKYEMYPDEKNMPGGEDSLDSAGGRMMDPQSEEAKKQYEMMMKEIQKMQKVSPSGGAGTSTSGMAR